MNPIKAFYCRTVQAVLRAALPVLPYREPEIFRSCAELHTVFTKKKIQRVLIVTDEGIVRNGIAGQLEAALDQCGVAYSVMAAHAEQRRGHGSAPQCHEYRRQHDAYRRYRGGVAPEGTAAAPLKPQHVLRQQHGGERIARQ